MQRREITADVLVVGNGGAGLRAAVEAAGSGCRVVLASKTAADRPNSTAVIAGWGAHTTHEHADTYFRMVVEEGNYLSDQELAWLYAHEVAERMPELRQFGVEMRLENCTLERPGTERDLWYFPGPRGRLGDAIRLPLRQAALARGAVVLDRVLATRLLTSGRAVTGATALDLATGDLLIIAAKCVILATGGASGLYARQNNPAGTTGDGYALAYNAGAELVDMEFDTFMMSHDDLRHLFSASCDEDRILATPGAHYSCGGVRVDHRRRAAPEGLYAAGEAAGGTFGSGRLGGSAVGDIIVSGYWAGRNAAEAAAGKPESQPIEDEIRLEERRLNRLLTSEGLPPAALRDELRQLMWRNVGPLRRDAGLASALEELRVLRTKIADISAGGIRELRDAVEATFMLDVAEVIAASALTRKESRGVHWRVDYPEPDNAEWICNVVCARGPDGMPDLRRTPVSLTRISEPGQARIGTAWSGGYVSP